MDANKNSYTFGFAIIMVVVVGSILAFLAVQLKPYQDANIAKEKMQDILSTIGFKKSETSRDEAQAMYPDFITKQLILSSNGDITVDEGVEVVDGKVKKSKAFEVDLGKELKKGMDEQSFPLYIAEKNDSTFYIIPLRGKGLWGPVWGYVSLEEDLNTIYGASFDHKTETPGLGAEISKEKFQKQFLGKKIMEDGSFVSVTVTKTKAQGEHEVDGISGGTITSVGVSDMIDERLSAYLPYFDKIKNNTEEEMVIEEPVVTEMDSLETSETAIDSTLITE